MAADSAIDSAVKELIDESASEIEKISRGDFRGLAKIADDFIGKYTKFIGDYEKYKAVFESDLVTPNDKAKLLYQEMKTDQILTQKLTVIQFELEAALNKFLGRDIYLTWVNTKTGKVIFKNENTLLKNEDFIKKIKAGEGRGKVSAEDISKNPINEAIKDIQKQIDDGVEKWKPVYTTAIQRFNEMVGKLNGSKDERKRKKDRRSVLKKKIDNKKATKEEKKEYEELKEISYFYYNERKDKDEETNHSKVLSNYGGRGRIAEAYIDIIMAPKSGDNSVSTLPAQLRRLNEHINVDRVSAIVKGDVVLKSNSLIQFAVKTGNFQMASFGQYYKFANNIKRIWDSGYLLTEKTLTKYLAKFADKAEVKLKLEEVAIKRAEEDIGKAAAEVSK